MSWNGYGRFAAFALAAFLMGAEVHGQLTWNTEMTKYSAILPLTLNDNVYRIRAKPPSGMAPLDIVCDVGITGTVLTDQRGTSASDPGEKVASGLFHKDDIDVMFSDRVFSGYHTRRGDRIIEKFDFDCGINVKYQNKKKVAQLEIRVGYVLPSGDVEGLTWMKINRKQRQLGQNINRAMRSQNDIAALEDEDRTLASTRTENMVAEMRVKARRSGIARQIDRLSRMAGREEEFRRDLDAFTSIEEYLKTKVNGCQVYVHFHHNGSTLPVDIDELKRAKIRPIQVFEEGKDPVKNRADGG